jgi:hypothetical protein
VRLQRHVLLEVLIATVATLTVVGCALLRQPQGPQRALVLAAGAGLAEVQTAHLASYRAAAARVRAGLPIASPEVRLAAYDLAMQGIDKIYDLRTDAIVEARRALDRAAQVLDGGRPLSWADSDQAGRALAVLLRVAREGALGLPPLPLPPALLQLANLLGRPARDGGVL